MALGFGVVLATLAANAFGQQCAAVGPATQGVAFNVALTGGAFLDTSPTPSGFTIDWGDGETSGAGVRVSGCRSRGEVNTCSYSVGGAHTYAEEMNGIRITVKSAGGTDCITPPFDVVSTDVLSSANAQGLWWVPGGVEAGSGITIAHQGGEVFATWFTYDTSGKAWWLSMLGSEATAGTFIGPIYVDRGPPFDSYNAAAVPSAVGMGTLTFTDANNGSFASNVNGLSRTETIARFDLGTGPQPICAYSDPAPDLSTATNYQDDWWATNGTEPGWGIGLAHQGNSVFATWYTYDADGTPMWLSALVQRQDMSNVYSGPIYRSSGTRFDAYDATKVVAIPVGTATFTFTNGNTATFAYTTTDAGGLPAVTQAKEITRFRFGDSGATVCQ